MHRALALPALLLAACGGATPEAGPPAPAVTTRGPTFELAVTGPADVALGAASTLTITIFGYDPLLADAGASVVRTQRTPLTALPLDVAVVLPEDAAARIDQGHGPLAADEARYYVYVYGDLDGDGQICPGELIQDYGTGNTRDFGPTAPETPVPTPMLSIEAGTACQPAFPGGERP